jgi:hypothetical protein
MAAGQFGDSASMKPTRSRPLKIVALLASGGLLLQTGACIPDIITLAIQQAIYVYLADAVQVIFYNIFNI